MKQTRQTAGPRAPKPMLASAMTHRLTGVDFDATYNAAEWWMEEKLDGHRCVVVVEDGAAHAFSRGRGSADGNGRDLPTNITEQLESFPDGTYDGELVAPSGKAWDVSRTGTRLTLVLFDVLHLRGQSLLDVPYGARRGMLLEVLAHMPDDQTAISTVESVFPSWAAVQAIWKRGGEGAILKRRNSLYRPGARTDAWVKVKQLHAATLTVVGFESGKSGPHSSLVLRADDGAETTVKSYDTEQRRNISRAPASYIGRRVVIAFQERTPAGSFRHPMFDHWAGAAE